MRSNYIPYNSKQVNDHLTRETFKLEQIYTFHVNMRENFVFPALCHRTQHSK